MPPVARAAIVFVSIAASSCRRDPTPSPAPNTTPSLRASASAGPAAISAPRPSSQGAPATPGEEEEAASRVVREWNDALDHHDTEKLARLYADEVRYYGRTLSRDAVISAKQKAFEKEPSFRQELIGKIEYERPTENGLAATFAKRSGAPGSSTMVSARLGLTRGDAGTFLVSEEADETTMPAAPAARGGCEATVAELVNAMPEVKRAIDDVQKQADKSNGRANFGGIGPNEDGEGGFSASYGLQTAERYEMLIVYGVDAKGHLSVSLPKGELAIPPKTLALVKEACRR